MRDFPASSPAVVVGIDGSPTAVDAALWAVDEAVSRDIPLRLVYAIDPDNTSGTDPQDAARDLAAAEVAVRYAYTAVESTDKPVKIEVEILHERPGRALLEASRSAAMACVGAMDLRHSAHRRIGSTAAALAASAHCPVAIVRRGHPNSTGQRWVVAEVDESAASNGVLRRAVGEARLREAPLRVSSGWDRRRTRGRSAPDRGCDGARAGHRRSAGDDPLVCPHLAAERLVRRFHAKRPRKRRDRDATPTGRRSGAGSHPPA